MEVEEEDETGEPSAAYLGLSGCLTFLLFLLFPPSPPSRVSLASHVSRVSLLYLPSPWAGTARDHSR